MITHEVPITHKFRETESRLKVSRDWREETNGEPLLNGFTDSVGNDEKFR